MRLNDPEDDGVFVNDSVKDHVGGIRNGIRNGQRLTASGPELPVAQSQMGLEVLPLRLLDRVNAGGDVLLTGCMPREYEGFLVQVCMLSSRTCRARVERCVEQLAEESAAILGRRVRARED